MVADWRADLKKKKKKTLKIIQVTGEIKAWL